jgi:hypothetical protein
MAPQTIKKNAKKDKKPKTISSAESFTSGASGYGCVSQSNLSNRAFNLANFNPGYSQIGP